MSRRYYFVFYTWLSIVAYVSSPASADVRLPAIVSDNMVLQQGRQVPIWGWADTGEEVSVEIAGQNKTVITDSHGKWSLKLDTLKPGGPFVMKIIGKNIIKVKNILVGEVWLGSGQSNMEQPIAGWDLKGDGNRSSPIKNYEQIISQAGFPSIRVFTVKKNFVDQPQNDVEGSWQECSPENAPDFSATGYFFSRHIHQELGIPVGFIHSSSGGSAIETWIPPKVFGLNPKLKRGYEFLQRTCEFEHWKKSLGSRSICYNGMIAPLIPYAIRGLIWYQGETNTVAAHEYCQIFTELINSWRENWGQGNFPVYYVQIAPYDYSRHVGQGWPIVDSPRLRQAQLETLVLPNTGMVVTSDIGDSSDIHPGSKKEVGKRLALLALGKTYGKDIFYSGPLYESMAIETDRIRIRFKYTDGGLKTRDGLPPTWFTIAGEDRKFVTAKAVIDGRTIIVNSNNVVKPFAVRFGWADAADHNLVNGAGLPASPFRSDHWPSPQDTLGLSQKFAQVTLPAIISDNMVLQQKVRVPIWGWSAPGEKITVKFAGQSKIDTADTRGRWNINLEPIQAGGPFEMTISGGNTIKLHNILIGEVWICSGQSNMEWPVSLAENAEQEILKSAFSNIRLFKVKKEAATKPMNNCSGLWLPCEPSSVSGFSAVGYFFGRELDKQLNLPIGLIDASWGASLAEAWIKHDALTENPEFKPILDRYNQALQKYNNFKDLLDSWLLYEEIQIKKWYRSVEAAKNENLEPPPSPSIPSAPPRQHLPSGLYNGMISPLIPFAIRGTIWYQGESNAERAYQYRNLFPTLIHNWRKDWKQGDFPFYYVQIAPFRLSFYEPKSAAELREAQLLALSVPNTGMAVTIDIGNPDDIHPRNKQEVGRRLASWALAKTYKMDSIVCSGPLYKSMNIENNNSRLFFDHVGSGLMAKHGRLTQFTIAGKDRKFVEAKAVIDSNTVLVSSELVSKPVAVRYAWSNSPEASLFNKEGLPASPFRTDNWAGVTEGKK